MPMRGVDYGGHFPPPSNRQLLTIGELERLYGRDATVEVDAAPSAAFGPTEPVVEQPIVERPIVERPLPPELPLPQMSALRDPGFYPLDDEEPDEAVVPRRRNPFVVLVLAVVGGAAALLGYGLYLRGYLDFTTLLSRAELAPSEEYVEHDRSFEVTSFPVRIGDGFRSEDRNAAATEPNEDAEEELGASASEQTLPDLVEADPPSAAPPAVAPPPAKARPRARPAPARAAATPQAERRRNTSLEDAATMEAIRRESARLARDRAAQERRIEQSITGSNADPPGYIEADEPAD